MSLKKMQETIQKLEELLDADGDFDSGIDTDNNSKIKVNRIEKETPPPNTDIIRAQTGGDGNPIYNRMVKGGFGFTIKEEIVDGQNTDRIVKLSQLEGEFNARPIIPVLKNLLVELKKYDTANPNTAIVISSVLAEIISELPMVSLSEGQKSKLMDLIKKG